MEIQQNLTQNITAANDNLAVLKAHFGHCFDKHGNFQMEKFKAELEAGELNFSKESYGLDWLGRSYSHLLASDAATTLLKEDVAFNQKPENINSQNLLLKGDNLEILKHLSHAYFEQVKMIYIDPPAKSARHEWHVIKADFADWTKGSAGILPASRRWDVSP